MLALSDIGTLLDVVVTFQSLLVAVTRAIFLVSRPFFVGPVPSGILRHFLIKIELSA